MLQLLYNENEIDKVETDMDKKNAELGKQKTRLSKHEASLKEKRQDQGKTSRELTTVEQLIKGVEVDLGRHQPNFIKAKEKTSHAMKKLEASKKQQSISMKTFEGRSKELTDAEKELADVEKRRNDFEKAVEKEGKKNRNVHLEADQLKEYHRLRDDVSVQSTKLQQELDGLLREERADNERLGAEMRKKQEVANRIQQKQTEMDENKLRRDKLEEHLKASQQALEVAREDEKKFEEEIKQGRKRYDEVTQELESIYHQLNDLSVDQSEISRQTRKAELIETLKSQFPGVYGRLLDLCQPTEKKYQIAVTKVFGKNIDAIVCDTDETARQCIKYLKDQRIEREVFMPLSYIRPKPINERLREIRDPRNVKLLFDVMKHDPSLPVLQKALLFACGNALVCEDIESARKCAFSLEERQKSVSLDGTLFQKSGVISGGASDLKQRARRWDEKEVAKLRNKKEKLRAELPEVERYRRRDGDLASLRSKIQGLQARINYSQKDLNNVLKDIERNEREIEELRRTLARDVESKIFEIQRAIDDRHSKILEPLRQKIHNIEDIVFANFCKKIKVSNIREYEQTQVKEQEDINQKRLEMENVIYQLKNNIDYLKKDNKKTFVDKWNSTVKKDERELEAVRKEEEHIKKVIDDLTRKLDGHKNHKNALKTQLSENERHTEEAHKIVQTHEREVQATQRAITGLENRLEQLKADRHMLLKTARLEEIRIPLKKGSLENVPVGSLDGGSLNSDSMEVDPSQDSVTTENAKRIYELESEIEVDYDDLDDDLTEISNKEEYEKALEKLRQSITDKKEQLSKVHAPNLKALERLDDVQQKVSSAEATFDTARKAAKKAQAAFERVKAKRLQRFQACLQHVADHIDGVYKTLARNAGAQAEITADNADEPYLGGIQYQCIAPGKRYRPMDSLSGGEKTIAALALLFSLHSFKPAPFFVLDEVDAALDNTNIAKVTSYIREKGKQTQFIVISLKEEFFCKSQALIGICPVVCSWYKFAFYCYFSFFYHSLVTKSLSVKFSHWI